MPFLRQVLARNLILLLTSCPPVLAQLTAQRSLDIQQADLGEIGESGDRFGAALASGDFDGDGSDDLAIGAPDEDFGAIQDAGAVLISYGTDGVGLGLGPGQLFHQGLAALEGSLEGDDRFGAVLAVGDFDGDTFDDLAIGVPGQDRGAASETGDVHVLYGSIDGLSTLGDQLWHQNSTGVPEINEIGDAFGSALAAGDFDDDGFDDLAIGIPGEDVGFTSGAGALVVLFGGLQGLSAAGSLLRNQGAGAEADDGFATALAAGDRDGDGIDDLFIGVPGEDDEMSSRIDNGLVMTSPGSTMSPLGSIQDTMQESDSGARLGSVLTSADFDKDGQEDIVGSSTTRGSQQQGRVLRSDPGDGIDALEQGFLGILDAGEPFDHMGEALAAGDFNDDGFADLAVGVAGENLDDAAPDPFLDAGLVHAIYGSESGLEAAGNQLWSLGTADVGLGDADNARFGGALAAGDFDNDGTDDLAVGVPGASLSEGLVVILYGRRALFADGFESGDTAAWSSALP